MPESGSTTVLFTGYAPVHFVCFRPVYERLIELAGFEVFVSGGLRNKTDSGYDYDLEGLYRPFGIPKDQMLTVDAIAERDFDLLFAANTKLITPRSVKTRIQIFHGISFRNRAIRVENMTCDYYFFAGPYMHRKFVEAELIEEDDPRALKNGFCKTDRLVNGMLNRDDLLRKYGLDGSRPVILYAPTGEKNNSLETMGEEVVKRLRDSGKYDLLIKPHDHPKNKNIDWFAQLAPYEDDHTKVVRELDVVPLLFLADLLITDASSVSSEYSLLDRPMIFLDVPKLMARMMEKDGSMLDIETWGRQAGTVVKKPERIVEKVGESLANPTLHAATRQAMAKDLFYNPGTATDAAVAWLRERFAPGAFPTVAISHSDS